MYACSYYLEPEVEWPTAEMRGISVVDRERWLALEPQLLALHERQYGRFGGGQRREPGYWRMILDGHVYGEHPWWLATLADEAGGLAGYLVAGQGVWAARERVHVYEVVGREDEDGGAAGALCASLLGGWPTQRAPGLPVQPDAPPAAADGLCRGREHVARHGPHPAPGSHLWPAGGGLGPAGYRSP